MSENGCEFKFAYRFVFVSFFRGFIYKIVWFDNEKPKNPRFVYINVILIGCNKLSLNFYLQTSMVEIFYIESNAIDLKIRIK